MPQSRNSLQGRIAQTTRNLALIAAIATGSVGIMACFVGDSWGVVLLATLAVCALSWALTGALAPGMLRDLHEVSDTIEEFNRGNTSARARLVGPSEIRELAARYNRMAKRAEEALTKVSEEERRESQFVSDVSHELQTPLTSIRGAAETLMEGDLEPEDQARFLNMIIADSARLSRLANDLITLQRIEGGTGELPPVLRFSLISAIERAKVGLAPILESRGIQFSWAGEAPPVLGNIDRIQQVIVNLVANAAKVLPEDGRIWIDIEAVARHALGPLVHEPGLFEAETFAKMTVSDDGPGIPEAYLPRLFDRFYRPQYGRDRSSGGSGLGLSIVKAIVTSHGGAVTARNHSNADNTGGQTSGIGGAQFIVFLPIPPETDTELPRPQRRPLPGQGREKALRRKQKPPQN
jgi:two-component system OmpR family sensor kinase